MHPKAVRIVSSTLLLMLCWLWVGCTACLTRQDPGELREKTAQTTAALKSDAKAIGQGVREGLKRDEIVDINRATNEQLTRLPGIDNARAERVIAARPYKTAHELVTRRVLSAEEYQRIREHITAR
jgi:competence protein ComEA